MAQTEPGGPVSFSLSAKNWAETNEQSELRSAQSSASCRRSGCSPAEPYPPHECLESTMPAYPLFQRGHLYFAEKGTFLLCVDRKNLASVNQT